MSPRLLFIAAALVASAAGHAEQKTVYRCGQTYQDSPCAGGKVVDVADERSDAERQAGLETARQQAELGSKLQRERLNEERDRRLAGAANLGAPPKKPPHAEPEHKFKPEKKKKEKTVVKATLKPYKPPKADQAG